MGDTAWKKAERIFSSIFGSNRRRLSGSSGRDDIATDDGTHPRLYLESKYRQSHAVWNLWKEAEAATRTEHKKKLFKRKRTVVIGLKQARTEGVLLCIHSDDLPAVVQEYLKAKGMKATTR